MKKYFKLGLILPLSSLPILTTLSCSKKEEKEEIYKSAYEYLKEIKDIKSVAGTQGVIDLRKKIIEYGKKLKLTPEIQEFNFNVKGTTINGKNIIFKIKGTENNQEIISFGAHYDIARELLTRSNKKDIGITDNKVGVATILGLLEHFTKNPPKKTMHFIFFDGEEDETHGSEDFVKRIENKDDLKKYKIYINLDGVAGGDEFFLSHGISDYRNRNNRGSGTPIGNGDKTYFDKFLQEAKKQNINFKTTKTSLLNGTGHNNDFDFQDGEVPTGLGDYEPFNKENIPVLWFYSSYGFDKLLDSNNLPLFNIETQTINKNYWKPMSDEEIKTFNTENGTNWQLLTQTQRNIGIIGGPENKENKNENGYPRKYEKDWGLIKHKDFDSFQTFEKNFPNRLETQLKKLFNLFTKTKY